MTDLEARRRAVHVAAQLPAHLPDAILVLRHAEAIARFTAGDVDRPEASNVRPALRSAC